jgi:hypothetical protein
MRLLHVPLLVGLMVSDSLVGGPATAQVPRRPADLPRPAVEYVPRGSTCSGRPRPFRARS